MVYEAEITVHACVLGGCAGKHGGGVARGWQVTELCVSGSWAHRDVFGVRVPEQTFLSRCHGSTMLPLDRMVAYFVVFHKYGFTPKDLRKAQVAGGTFGLRALNMRLNIYFSGYFLKSSPDFINSRGRHINAQDQVLALARAQGIGKT